MRSDRSVSKKHPDIHPKDIRILDWGCGRGRAVLKLLNRGYSAFGVDLDVSAMKKGYKLFKQYCYTPQNHLLSFEKLEHFDERFFIVFFLKY